MGPTVHLAMGLKLLFLLATLLATCVLVVWILRRPRRRGTTPHCARCDYNLTGLLSDRCPECGSETIPPNIVYGELVRRPWLKVTVGVCVAILAFVAAQYALRYDYYRLRPASWVIGDLQSSTPQVKFRAWTEIVRRIRSGALPASQESRLIDVCLAEQTATNAASALIDHLGASLLAGKMSESQKATFFKQIVQVEMRVRPTVIAGATLPYSIRHTSRGPSQPGLWISLMEGGTARLDGRPTRRLRGNMGSSGMSGCGAGGSSSSSIALTEWEGPIAPGLHRVAVAVQVEVWDHYPEGKRQATCYHRAEIPLEGSFELLAAEPSDYVKLIDDPSQKPALQDAIQPKDLRPTRRENGVEFKVECKSVPVGIAFELLARVDGTERRIGSLHLAKGESSNWHMSGHDLPRHGSFDLILRSSKKVAMETVDLFEIWQGELVFPNLRADAQTSPPTTTTSSSNPAR